MTREEAIKILEQFKKCLSDVVFDEKGSEAWQMAIKALEQEPCDDAVSRAELLKAIDTWDKFGYTETGCFVREPKGDYVPYIHYDDVIKCIKGMPSVTQKSDNKYRKEAKRWKNKWLKSQKTGKWEYIPQDEGWYICSECGCGNEYADNFCPQCGAKMESEE